MVAIALASMISLPVKVNAYDVYGFIGDKYKLLGGAGGPLGAPTSSEDWTGKGFGTGLGDCGRFNNFQNGFIYYHRNSGAFAVYGLIGEEWNRQGREEGKLGYPISDEFTDGQFRRSNFRYGYIRHSPSTGIQVTVTEDRNANKVGKSLGRIKRCEALPPPAAAVPDPNIPYGLIGAAWGGLGGPLSPLGKPLSPEQGIPDRPGRIQSFEHGQISWTPGKGNSALLIAYQAGNSVEIFWGGTEPYNYDFWQVRTDSNGANISQNEVRATRTSGWFIQRNTLPGKAYTFLVEGCDEKGIFGPGALAGCRQGWMIPVSVTITSNPIKTAATFADPLPRESLCWTDAKCLKGVWDTVAPYLKIGICAGSAVGTAATAGAAAPALASCAGLAL